MAATAERPQVTTKTKRTLAMIDSLAGVPHIMGANAQLVIPLEAWTLYGTRNPPDLREWWQTSRAKYDSGLLLRIR